MIAIDKIKSVYISKRDFNGDPDAFFLATEGWRIHFAYQFDPLCAVNVSQIDPLPHQIEAVYHYILKNPRIRFLLADQRSCFTTDGHESLWTCSCQTSTLARTTFCPCARATEIR